MDPNAGFIIIRGHRKLQECIEGLTGAKMVVRGDSEEVSQFVHHLAPVFEGNTLIHQLWVKKDDYFSITQMKYLFCTDDEGRGGRSECAVILNPRGEKSSWIDCEPIADIDLFINLLDVDTVVHCDQ